MKLSLISIDGPNPKIISRKTFWLLFAIMSFLGLIYWFMFDFLRWDMFDSPSFMGGARLLFGLEGGFDFQSRLSKPMVLLIPGLFEYLFGWDVAYIFILQSTISYYVSGYLIYHILILLFNDREKALGGFLAYLMCQSVALFAFNILADMPGWMFGLLIIWRTLVAAEHNPIRAKDIVYITLIAVTGLQVKESAAFGFIFFVFYLFFREKISRRFLFHILLSGATFMVAFGAIQLFTWAWFNNSIFNRIVLMRDDQGFVFYNLSNIAQVFRILDFYWVLFFLGLITLKPWNLNGSKKDEIKALTLSILASLLLIPVYPFIVDRIMFMVAPGLVVFIAQSKNLLGKYYLAAIILGGIFNIAVTWLIYMYDIHGLFAEFGILYFLLILIFIFLNRKLKSLQSAFGF